MLLCNTPKSLAIKLTSVIFFGFPLGDYTVKNMVPCNAEEPEMVGYAEGCFACLSVCR